MNGQLRKNRLHYANRFTCTYVCAWVSRQLMFCETAFLHINIQDGDLDDFMKTKPRLYCGAGNCQCRLELTLAYQ